MTPNGAAPEAIVNLDRCSKDVNAQFAFMSISEPQSQDMGTEAWITLSGPLEHTTATKRWPAPKIRTTSVGNPFSQNTRKPFRVGIRTWQIISGQELRRSAISRVMVWGYLVGSGINMFRLLTHTLCLGEAPQRLLLPGARA